MVHIPTLSLGKNRPIDPWLTKQAWKNERLRFLAHGRIGVEAHERYNEPFPSGKLSRLLAVTLSESMSSARSISS